MLIDLPDNLEIATVEEAGLKKHWENINNFSYCQSIAVDWLNKASTAILKVPSAIIRMEHNYLVNPQHPEFKLIKLTGVEDFNFDARF